MESRQDIDIKSRVSDNIRLAIEQEKLTVAEVARRIGGHERAVRRWRNGEGAPDIDSLASLAVALDREIGWFYEDHEPEAAAA